MTHHVGIDVSKDWLDVHILDGAYERFPNTASGCHDLAQKLASLSIDRIALEATGSYQRLVVATLVTAGLPVVVANPRQVRDFAKGNALLAKTDKLDAFILAKFAQIIRPELRKLPDEQAQNLQDLLARRAQLIEMQTMETNRLHQAAAARVIKDLKSSLEFIGKRLERLNKEIDDQIRQSPAWQEKVELLKSVPGIGPQTARVLVVDLPELGTGSRQNAAALVGIAPLNDDSGKKQGKRFIRGGRKVVRCTLYMATLSAVRCNEVISRHYKKLRAAGKPFKVAMVACMRKLLTILNAMIRENQPWKIVPAT